MLNEQILNGGGGCFPRCYLVIFRGINKMELFYSWKDMFVEYKTVENSLRIRSNINSFYLVRPCVSKAYISYPYPLSAPLQNKHIKTKRDPCHFLWRLRNCFVNCNWYWALVNHTTCGWASRWRPIDTVIPREDHNSHTIHFLCWLYYRYAEY